MTESESDKGLIYSPATAKDFYPQIIPWIMGISKFGRRAVGGDLRACQPKPDWVKPF